MDKRTWRHKGKIILALVLTIILGCERLYGTFPWISHAVETRQEALIKNGDFELGRNGDIVRNWSLTSTDVNCNLETTNDWTSNYNLLTEEQNGNKVAAFSKKGTGYAAMTSQNFSVESGTAYRLNYDYFTREYTASTIGDFQGIRVVVEQFDKDGNQISWKKLHNTSIGIGQDASTEWTNACYDFVTDEKASTAKVHIRIGGPYDLKVTVLIDNVIIEGYDLFEVPNGDFSGKIDEAEGGRRVGTQGPGGWSSNAVNGEIKDDTTQTYHNYHAAILTTDSEKGQVMKYAPIDGRGRGQAIIQSPYISVSANATFNLQYDRKITGTTSFWGSEARISYYNAKKQCIGTVVKDKVTSATNTWQTKRSTGLTTPADAVYMKIGFTFRAANSGTVTINNAVYIDNVLLQVTSVPVNGWKIVAKTPEKQETVDSNYSVAYQGVEGTYEYGTVKLQRRNNWYDADLATPKYGILPDKYYSVSFDYQVKNITGKSTPLYFKPYVKQYDNDGNVIKVNQLYTEPVMEITQDSTQWDSTPTYEFKAAVNAACCEVYVDINPASGENGAFNKYLLSYDFYVKNLEVMLQKSILFVGDEIGSGMAKVAESSNKVEVTDACVEGAGFSADLSAPITNQIREYAVQPYDFVVINGGTHDVATNMTVGEVTDNASYMDGNFDTTTFAGALEDAFRSVAEYFDDIQIAYVFPNNAEMNAYHQVAEQATQKWGIEFVDLTVGTDDEHWQQFEECMDSVAVFDRDTIPGISVENILEKQYNLLVEGGITPATNIEALQRLLAKTRSENLADLEQKIDRAVQEYEMYRVTICGATIAKKDANQLRFFAISPSKVLPEGVAVRKMGILTLPEDYITPRTATYSNEAALKVGNDFVTDIETTYTKPTAVYDGILSGSAVDPAMEYAAIAYVIYEVAGKEYILYSANNYWKDIGQQSAINGVSKKSVYSIAKEMAQILVENQEAQLNYDAIGGKKNITQIESATEKTEVSLYDVFCLVTDNSALLNEALRVGGAF